MKILVTIVVVALLLVLVAGCVRVADRQRQSADFGWAIVQSPITGRYYEIATRANSAYMGMSEVTEKEYLEYVTRGK